MSRQRIIGVVLFALTLAQLFHAQSQFVEIDTAKKLLEEYADPTVIGIGMFILTGFVAGVMAFFRIGGWRIGVLVAVALYVWAVWYPEFLRLVFKYGLWAVLSGIFDQARLAGTLGSVVLHKVLYPLGFLALFVATLWDLRSGGDGD
jgi:hypothetical protein